jgi:energy-coupling factor transport system ATP-binding protein
MAVQAVRIELNGIQAIRNSWSLSAQGSFERGVHLVTGDVGSGKSTLSLILAGLFPASAGSVEREDISTRMISFQYPEYHITGSTIDEECASWGLDTAEVLHSAELPGKESISPLCLSRGELKRLHLACVLSGDYDLLILDEPFSSLDCRGKERICRILSERREGITIIFTHEQTDFPRVDRIWDIRDGELRDLGELPEALMCWYHAPVVIKKLILAGKIPKNLTPADLLEAACRT